LDIFYKFADRVRDSEYKAYLTDLLAYLVSFIQRSQPLLELKPILKEAEDTFHRKYAAGDFDRKDTTDSLYCAACGKNFAKDTVFNAHLSGKKHQKATEKSSGKDCLLFETKIATLCTKLLLETISNSRIHVEKKIGRKS